VPCRHLFPCLAIYSLASLQLILPPYKTHVLSPDEFLFLAANNEGQTFLWPAHGVAAGAAGDRLQTLDLTGPDFDAVYGVAIDGAQTVYTACADGHVRMYNLDFDW
jgi:hypothetical protein